MPTGYTAILTEQEGTTFPQFAIRCARAFGALYHMRDDPWDAPLRFRGLIKESSAYQQEYLDSSKERLASLEAMTAEERLALGVKARDSDIESSKRSLEKCQTENKIYEDMIVQVNAWTPPTADHVELKKFMLEQLETSLRNTTYYASLVSEAEARDPAEYHQDEVRSCQREIDYYKKQVETRSRDKSLYADSWIVSLCDSLGLQHPKKP